MFNFLLTHFIVPSQLLVFQLLTLLFQGRFELSNPLASSILLFLMYLSEHLPKCMYQYLILYETFLLTCIFDLHRSHES